MAKYRKKPVVIDAVIWNGTNFDEIHSFCPNSFIDMDDKKSLVIDTLEGFMLATAGDYIIKGIKGEFYPCKPDIFDKTYEACLDDEDSNA